MNRSKKILIVDDDNISRLIARRVCELSPYDIEVEVHENGYQAMLSIKNAIYKAENLPDIIILDIEMPVMDGWAFLKEYVTLPPGSIQGINLYMVTSSSRDGDKKRAVSSSLVKDYFPKPFTNHTIDHIMNVF